MADKEKGKHKDRQKEEDTSSSSSMEEMPPPPDGMAGSPPPSPARRPGAGLIVIAAVVILAVIAAAALTQAPVRARLARLLDTGAATQDAALAKRVDRLAADVTALQDALKNVPDGARVAALEKRVDDMAKAQPPAAGADAAKVAALETRLDDLAAKVEGLTSKAQAQAGDRLLPLMLAVTGALDSGRSLAALAPALRNRLAALGPSGAAARGDLDALAPFLDKGVPTASMLAARAGTLELTTAAAPKDTSKSAAPAATDGGLWSRIKARFSGLVTIHRVEGREASADKAAGNAASLDPVRSALATGDVAAAHAALAALDVTGLDTASKARLIVLTNGIEGRLAADRLAGALDALVAAAAPSPPASSATP